MTYDAKIAKTFNIFLATIHKACRYYQRFLQFTKKKQNT